MSVPPRILLILLLFAPVAPGARAEPILEAFNGPTVALRPISSGAGFRLQQHRRDRSGEGGKGAETVQFRCDNGYAVLFAYDTPPLAVLEELSVRVHLRASAPGARVGVRVSLPRTLDPRTKKPLETIALADGPVTPAAGWVWLELRGAPKVLAAQARTLRVGNAQLKIDTRGAQATAVVVSVPGSAAGSTFSIDQIEVQGAEPASGVQGAQPGSTQQALQPVQANDVRSLATGGIVVNGRPLHLRVWVHQGESLQRIAGLGFNAVAMRSPPVNYDLEDAQRLGLWLLCPAPPDIAQRGAELRYSRVLAWWIDGTSAELTDDQIEAEVAQLRAADTVLRRPILVDQHGHRHQRTADLVVVDAQQISAGPAASAGRLMRVRVTEPERLLAQRAAMATRQTLSPWRNERELGSEIVTALRGGSVGLWFEGSFELTKAPAAARAADGLAMVNRKLELLGPWLVADRPTLLPGGALSWRRERSQLVLDPEALTGASTIDPLALARDGASAAVRAYRVSLAGVESIDSASSSSPPRQGDMLLLTEDPRDAMHMGQKLRADCESTAEIATRLAVDALARLERLKKDLGSAAGSAELDAVKKRIGEAKTLASTGDPAGALGAAEQARAALNAELKRISPAPSAFQSCPLVGDDDLIPDLVRLGGLLSSLPRGPNLLEAGDFEDLDACRAAGWKCQLPQSGATGDSESRVDVARVDPVHGAGLLRIKGSAWGGDATRVESPPLATRPGEVIEIVGWVRYEPGPGGSLRVIDSLGGEPLAVEIERATPWRAFHILRSGTGAALSVAFEIQGQGVAGIDAVMVRQVLTPGKAPTPTSPGQTLPFQSLPSQALRRAPARPTTQAVRAMPGAN